MVLHKWRFPFRSWVLVNILAVIRATRDGDLCFQIVNLISYQEGTNTFLCSQRHASWMPYRVKVWINPGSRYLIGKLPVAKLVKKCPDCMEVEDVYNSLLLLLVNTLVVPKVMTIWGLNLPGTRTATSACRWTPLLFFFFTFYFQHILGQRFRLRPQKAVCPTQRNVKSILPGIIWPFLVHSRVGQMFGETE